MKKLYLLLFAILIIFSSCLSMEKKPYSDTYFVRADGNDRNHGLSEDKPFRSLFKAVVMANAGSIKTITVIGKLDADSEQSSNKERVFLIQGIGKDTILILGKSTDTENAVLSAEGSGKRVVLIKGSISVRFENIEISGGMSKEEGGGIGIGPGSSVTLGRGAVICNNHADSIGGGVLIAPGGSLYIDGGKIFDNQSEIVGGGIAIIGTNSVLIIKDGEVRNNHAQGGGGVAVFQESCFTLSGGTINDNTASIAGGGVIVNISGSFTMAGGMIRGNRSSGSGGGIALMEKSIFVLENGEIQNNRAAEHGGGIASDDTGSITVKGGFISANRAADKGGGIFTAGPFVKSAGKIYGSDMTEDAANIASSGAAICIFSDGILKTREISAGDSLVLDASADDGWTIIEE
jgi:predicted outer membrane repeat protein